MCTVDWIWFEWVVSTSPNKSGLVLDIICLNLPPSFSIPWTKLICILFPPRCKIGIYVIVYKGPRKGVVGVATWILRTLKPHKWLRFTLKKAGLALFQTVNILLLMHWLLMSPGGPAFGLKYSSPHMGRSVFIKNKGEEPEFTSLMIISVKYIKGQVFSWKSSLGNGIHGDRHLVPRADGISSNSMEELVPWHY